MGRHEKNSRKTISEKAVLATALVNLITALIKLIEAIVNRLLE